MKRMFWGCLLIFGLVLSLEGVDEAAEPLIADHQSANDFSDIPTSCFALVRSTFDIYYGHTSHGSQIITGISMLENQDSTLFVLPTIYDDYNIDLGNSLWISDTRDYLDNHPETNLVMWSWCGQLSWYEESEVENYLSQMTGLEAEYPRVTFIYMTGHLDGDGPSETLYTNNDRIRAYCGTNNKVLYDFADIESYNPDGTYYPYGSDSCEWCKTWCASHDCPAYGCEDCAHSQCFNCYRKGKAFWWLLARLAGWKPSGTIRYVDKNGNCGEISPCYQTIQGAVDAAHTGDQVRIAQGTYAEDIVLNEPKELILYGGWNSMFTTRTSYVTIKSIRISDGTVRTDYLLIR